MSHIVYMVERCTRRDMYALHLLSWKGRRGVDSADTPMYTYTGWHMGWPFV